MDNSNNDSLKQDGNKRLTKEEDMAEDEEIKAKLFSHLYDTRDVDKKTLTNNRKTKTPKRADGVKVPGICPDCGGNLRTMEDKHGFSYTVCEHFKDGCIFYVPYKTSHFI